MGDAGHVVFGVQVGGLFAGFGLVPEVFLGVQNAVGVELARGGLERVLGEVLAFGGWGFGRVGLAERMKSVSVVE